MEIRYIRYNLYFRQPSGTSRGVLTQKTSWFLILTDPGDPGRYGIGECGPLPGLSPEDPERMDKKLAKLVRDIREQGAEEVTVDSGNPSIRFGLETALTDFSTGGKRILFPSDFIHGSVGIPINGLIWMGDPAFMKAQIREKMENGFRVIKIKIGSLDFEAELDVLRYIRLEYHTEYPEIRLDANGAFKPGEVREKLNRLSEFDIHSIEQPIAPRQWEIMTALCASSPIPVALDEELTGVYGEHDRELLLTTIKPHYIILKPTLLGGFRICESWIDLAGRHGAGWWVTSALESGIGLNAIAQWTNTLKPELPQGLGTGQIYKNNFNSPLTICGDRLFYLPEKSWNLNALWQR